MIPTFMAGKYRLLAGPGRRFRGPQAAIRSRSAVAIASASSPNVASASRSIRRAFSSGPWTSGAPPPGRRHGIRTWRPPGPRPAPGSVVDTSSTASGGSPASSRSNAISAAARALTSSPRERRERPRGASRRPPPCRLERSRERVGAAPFADDQDPHAANPYQVNGLPSCLGSTSPPPGRVLRLWCDEAATGPLSVGVGATRHLLWYLSYQITGETREMARAPNRGLAAPTGRS